ncbi:hypothetical protein Tco_0844822 [Tanacetum coccineum]
MVILFTEQSFSLLSPDVDFASTLPMTNALFGVGNIIVSLRSIEIISDVVGLSVALFCTHRRRHGRSSRIVVLHKIKTPKLKISDLMEKVPSIAYSGGI